MDKRKAIQILMLSPLYFKLSLMERKELIVEFLNIHMPLQKLSQKKDKILS